MNQEYLIYNLFVAYYEARKNKRNTINQLRFEINYEHEIFRLADEIMSGCYTPRPSICFVINDPVKREIMATDFRDRVVHHLIFNYINPECEKQFIHDSYSCRKGKGTLYGIKRVEQFVKECSNNHTEDCYILKLDIEGYFMSINKEILYEKVISLCQVHSTDTLPNPLEGLGIELIRETIFNDPTKNCIIKGSRIDWKDLPKSKSLFFSEKKCGLPIGNLTSQLFSNVYLHDLDCYIKNNLKIEYYGRYVDDFVIVHKDKEFLTSIVPQIADFLQKKLKLTLHPKKIYLQHYSKGVKFLGAVIKPNRLYIANRTKGKFLKKMVEIEKQLEANKSHLGNLGVILQRSRSSINSYLGIMQHYKTYNIIKKAMKLGLSIFPYGYFESKDKITKFKLKYKTKKQFYL
ncbi:hypothetical protein FACS1894178_7600 [Bacteroidia bacterium]|nr:hypothetical protein FACS1894178_7600 [Bacteroidia bacterium]